ncbi:MAG: hypothetical protein LBD16_09470 [Oscillospiraceae bacterium]|jgi:tetratricopeptide (TPR) repeat protein|nr:hypothetical protein [Oscillospiraceae bacterium]
MNNTYHKLIAAVLSLFILIAPLSVMAQAIPMPTADSTATDIIALYEEGKAEDARALLNIYVAQNRTDLSVHYERANILGVYDEPELALEAVEDSLSLFPDSAELLLAKGKILDFLYRFEEAVEFIGKAIDASAGDDSALYYLNLQLYDAASRGGMYDEATRALERVLALDDSTEGFVERASYRLWTLYSPKTALNDLNAILRREPDNIEALQYRVFAHLWLDEYDEALADAEAAAKADANFGTLLRGIAYIYAEDAELAMAELNRFIENNPDNLVGYLYRGILELEVMFDLDAAEADFKKCVELDSTDSDGWRLLASVYKTRGLLTEELETLSYDELYYDSAFILDRGLYYVRINDAEMAAGFLELMRTEFPNCFDTLWLEIWYQTCLRDFGAAVLAYEKMEAQFPFLGERYILNKAAMLAAAGRRADALAIVEANPAESLYDNCVVASVYTLLGMSAEAEELLGYIKDNLSVEELVLSPAEYHSLLITYYLTAAEFAYTQGDSAECAANLERAYELGHAEEENASSWVFGGDGVE